MDLENGLNKIKKRLTRPSETTSREKKDIVKRREKQLSRWKKNLTSWQIKNIMKVVDLFKVDFYTSDPNPNHRKLNENI